MSEPREPNPFAAFAVGPVGPAAMPTENPFAAFKPIPQSDYFAKLGPHGDALAAQPSGLSAILHAYGHGVADAWGAAPLGLSEENAQWLREHGLFNDYEKGHLSFWKTANEALIRDAALVSEFLLRGTTALTYGGIRGLAETPGVPGVVQAPAGTATALMEASPEGGLLRLGPLTPRAPGFGILEAARAAKIIGPEGEAGWKGTAPAPPRYPIPRVAPEPMAEPPTVMPMPGPEAYTPQPPRLPLFEGLPELGVPETYNIGGTRIPADTLLLAYERQVAAGAEPARAAETAVTEAARDAEAKPLPPLPPGTIASDVTRQLVSAGRPQEEAEAAAALVEAHYRARAAWFGGAKGTAEDLYAAEAPHILGPRAPRPAPAAVPPEPLLTGEAPPPAPRMPEGVPMPPDLLSEIQRRSAAGAEPARPTAVPGAVPAAAPELAAKPSVKEPASGEPTTDLEQARRGRISFPDQAQATIRLLKTADASTFIHETGHAWLEELIRDAADARAPAQLVADAKTVRDWAGAKEGGPISRAGHERFARGFERYMMEGQAPTPALAGVFERFKQWLTDIYQTVRGLRAPITDDIRRVFDRMLTGPEGEGAPRPTEPPEIAKPPLTETPVSADGTPKPEPVPPTQVAGAETGRQPEGRLLDKAGNIRLDNIETTEDIKQALRDSADRNDDFLQRRRGVVSDAQREDLATLLGTTPDKVLTKGIGEAFTDSEIKFLERTLAQSAGRLHELAVKAVASGADVDRLAATEALLRHDMIQGLFSQATAEAGRALRAFRRSREYWSQEATAAAKGAQEIVNAATGRTFSQMDAIFRQIASFDQAGKITRFTRDALKPGLFDWLLGIRINGLLSGPLTHTTYTAAGHIFGLFRAGVEIPFSVLVDRIRAEAGFLGREHTIRIGEARAALYGQGRGAGEGVRVGWSSWKTGGTEKPVYADMVDAVSRRMARDEGLTEGSPAFSKRVEQLSTNPAVIEEANGKLPPGTGQPQAGAIGVIPGRIGRVIESPSRMVAALHSFNWTAFYRQSISVQAYRAAVREGLTEASPDFIRRVAQLEQEPPEEIIREASADADTGALVTKPAYDSFTGKLSRALNTGFKVPDVPYWSGRAIPMGTFRPGKWIDPFVVIRANLVATAAGRTPLGWFSQNIRDDLLGRNGAEAFSVQAGKMLAGSTLALAAGGLWMAGKLNDSGPSDPKEAAAYRRRNGLPHGLNVGGLSFNILRMGNLGLQMSVAADLARAAHHGIVGDEDALQIGSDLVQSFAHNILDESFTRGPQEAMEAVTDPDRYGARWIRAFVASSFPFSVGLGQVAREVDPYARRARTMLDAINTKIPGLSAGVQPLFDVWGQPVLNQGWALTYYEHVARNDPVELELDRLGVYPEMPEARIRGVLLTDQQYADYSRTRGQLLKQRLDQMIGSSAWQMYPDVMRHEAIAAALKKSNAYAEARVMMESLGTTHDITAIAHAAKRAAMQGATPAQVREVLRAQP